MIEQCVKENSFKQPATPIIKVEHIEIKEEHHENFIGEHESWDEVQVKQEPDTEITIDDNTVQVHQEMTHFSFLSHDTTRSGHLTMDLDIKTFIYEIQRRPTIWDVASDDYSNRERKKNAWEELVNIFINKDEPSDDEKKKQFGQQLQRRWKSLRDSYSRELKIQREVKSGTGSRKRPVYVFFNHLSFLEKIIASKETTNSLMEEQERDLSSTLPSPVPKKQKQVPVGEKLVSAVARSVHSREQREKELESDCDRMFLLSLLNPLKQIPEHARFGVRRKLMEVIEAEMKVYRPCSADESLISISTK